MKTKNRKRKALYALCVILVLIATVLLVVTLMTGSFNLKDALLGRMRIEMIYLLVIIFLALPVLLLLLAIVIRMDTKKAQKKPRVLNVTGVSLAGGQATVLTDTVATQDPKAEKAQEDEGEIAEEENEGKGRFCKLCNLDEIRVSLQRANYDDHITLRQFCENFRNYAASRLKLYYDIDDIRR
ncbi:MAG: hypothetical protein J6B45_01505, partial [Clostridia bacterium]|nr:hypothetical protein [Clostridia bacterium]